MHEHIEPGMPSVQELQARLREVADVVRQAEAIDPAAQQSLAELLDELTRVLGPENLPAAEITQLAETTIRLAESLEEEHEQGLVDKARDRLERTLSNAEAHAPTAVGLGRQLLQALANIGI